MRLFKLNIMKTAAKAQSFLNDCDYVIDESRYPLVKCTIGDKSLMLDLDTGRYSGNWLGYIQRQLDIYSDPSLDDNWGSFTKRYMMSIGLGDILDPLTFEEQAWDEFRGIDDIQRAEKDNGRRIFFDMDGTLAVWNTGATMEEVFTPGYFRKLAPIQGMVDFAKELHDNGYDVHVLSKSCFHAIDEKYRWLKEHMPWLKDDHMLFVPLEADKEKFIPGFSKDDVLIDDYEKNFKSIDGETGKEVIHFSGICVKCITDINTYNPAYPMVFYDKSPKENRRLLKDALEMNMRDNKDVMETER